MGIEPIDAAHGRRGTFDNLWLEVMHEIEHRLDEGTATETNQRDALFIGCVCTGGMPDRSVE